jgi:RNA polymerase sigma factor (sigma-70 family)
MTTVPADLVRRAVAGDQAAWHDLIQRYRPLIRAIARSHGLGSADAEDLCQLCWLRLAQHLPALRDPATLPGWLATTARRAALRMISTREHPTGTLPPVPHDTLESDVIAADRNRTLWDTVARLPHRCRTLLSLVAHHPELTYTDLASTLGMPCGSIGPTRTRCLTLLRRKLHGLI